MSGFVRVNKRVGAVKATATAASTTTPITTPQQQQQRPSHPPQHQDPTKLGTGGTIAQPVMISAQTKSQQRVLSQVAAAAQMKIPNGCKPWVSNQFLTSVGIRDLDSILGGGIPLHTLNTIISDPRTKHHDVFTKAHLWDGYLRKQRCVLVTNLNESQALRLSKEVLKPALTNQEQRSGTIGKDNDVNNTATQSNDENNKSGKNKKSIESIDDEEDTLFAKKRTKPTKITQGSVQDALHDGANAKLTIAWQYDKYKNKTMDDSNLSGVNDDDIIDDDENNNNSDVEEPSPDENNDEIKDGDKKQEGKRALNVMEQINANSTCTLSTLVTQFDYHIITPHSSTLSSQQLVSSQSSLFPTFGTVGVEYHRHAILSQLTKIVNAPPSTTALHQYSTTTPISDVIIPSRIVIELTPELLTDYPINDNTNTHNNNLRNISVTQFLYSLHSLASTTPSIITMLIPSSVINNTALYNIIFNLSQLIFSLASFTAQTTLSNQTILQSQLGSAYNLFGDKHDGLLTVYRLPRVNTPSYSYKLPDSTLFLYRLKKQLTATLTSTSTSTMPTFGIAKLVLPPEVSRSGDAHNSASNSVAKDLFDEAIVEIAKRTKPMNANTPEDDTKSTPKGSSSSGKSCPTCGSDIDNHPDKDGGENGNNTGNSKMQDFNSSSKTAKQQQLMNERQADMIIEEGEEEDEDDDIEPYRDELE